MPAETQNVFIDTQVFDQHKLDFQSPKIRRLTRLAAEGELKLVLTDVTLGEIEAHVNELAESASKDVADFRRKMIRVVRDGLGADKLSALDALTQEELATRIRKEFHTFLEKTKAQIVSVDSACPSDVFKKYFRNQPPFDTGKKKEEFPDAFAGSALKAWCKNSPPRTLYIVSDDPDWKWLCDETDEFIHIDRLDELLEQFTDSEVVAYLKDTIKEEKADLIEKLKVEFDSGNVYFYVDDSIVDGEVVEIERVEITVDNASVIESDEGYALVGLLCNVKVALGVSGMDPNSTWRDPDDHSLHSVWSASGTIEREIEMEATVEISYDPTNPQDISIGLVSFQDEAIGISVDEHELTVDYDEDEDYEDYDPQWEPGGTTG